MYMYSWTWKILLEDIGMFLALPICDYTLFCYMDLSVHESLKPSGNHK